MFIMTIYILTLTMKSNIVILAALFAILSIHIASAQKVVFARSVLDADDVKYQIHFNSKTDSFDVDKPVYMLCNIGKNAKQATIKGIIPFNKKQYEREGGERCIGPYPFPDKTLQLYPYDAKCHAGYALQFDKEVDSLIVYYSVKNHKSQNLNPLLVRSLEKFQKKKILIDKAYPEGVFGSKWIIKFKDGSSIAVYLLGAYLVNEEYLVGYVIIENGNNFIIRAWH